MDDRKSNGRPKPKPLQGAEATETIELREERLVPRKQRAVAGEITVRTIVEEAPAHLEVQTERDDVEVEHEPVGTAVNERAEPYEENGEMIVPVYEEQLVVTTRLVLKERLHIRRISTLETKVFEEPLKRERVVIDDPAKTGLVRERYAKEGNGSP